MFPSVQGPQGMDIIALPYEPGLIQTLYRDKERVPHGYRAMHVLPSSG